MTVQRITGMASGMDIDSIVTKMMMGAKQPLIKLQQKQQILEWQRDDYRTLNQKYYDFRTALSDLKLTSKYRARNTTSSDESVVTATAANTAALTSTTIQNVKQLATAATRISKSGQTDGAGKEVTISGSTKIDTDASLLSQESNFSTPITWKSGTVVSKSITAGSNGTVTIDLTNAPITTDENGKISMNVTVNGKTYKAVDSSTYSGLTDKDDYIELQLSTDQKTGTLTNFSTSLSEGTSINTEYIASSFTESKTLTATANTMQLSRSVNPYRDGKYSVSISDGSTSYSLVKVDDDTANIKNGDTTVGTLNTSSGLITMNDLSAETNLTVTYHENYTTMNLGTYEEDGDKHTANFYIKESDSLNDVISDVNHSGIGVTMYYDENADKVSLTRKVTGDFNPEGTEIDTGTDTNDFLNRTLQFAGTDSTETGGENAEFTINGLTTSRTSNTFTISGVTYTLKNTFNTDNVSGRQVTVNVSNDTDTIYNNIKDFVDKYNDLIDTVQKKLDEERYSDYAPLTDDQRSELTDEQQEKWETKAKSGLLRNDMTFKSSLSSMRSLIYQKVNNPNISSQYNQLSSIGITTTADWLEGGKLEIDESKLKAAIEADPDSVELLFRGTGSSTSEEGIIQRLYDSVNHTYNTIVDKAGKSTFVNDQFTIGKDLNSVTKKISDMNDKLDNLEDRYYAQFTAMEEAIQKYNNQYSYLSSYFSS
ncbi:flagellar filament capping protein FliD [Heyndrickxia acidiproducens]|uniref:flagellar filament capping protein FliD n=1 Tax=Heyndrickxia acidiproducens TaxID=1121084 RepID=UPI000365E994|nr:flagellar filament capping protein FliD [Heyndrickxia acidiproducens]